MTDVFPSKTRASSKESVLGTASHPSTTSAEPNLHPLARRLAYQTGFSSAVFINRIHSAWLNAEEGEDPPRLLPRRLNDFRSSLGQLARLLPAKHQQDLCKGLLDATTAPWNRLERKLWQGRQHGRLIEQRNAAEPEGLTLDWERRNSVLDKPLWLRFRHSLDNLVGVLAPELSLCWRAGSLIAQVVHLDASDCQQPALLGDEFPVCALQTLLIEVRCSVNALHSLNVVLDGFPICDAAGSSLDVIKESARRIHAEILQRLSTPDQAKVNDNDPEKQPKAAKQGRRCQWADLYRMHEEMKAQTPNVTDEKIIATYNQRFSRRSPKPTVRTLRNFRSHRKKLAKLQTAGTSAGT